MRLSILRCAQIGDQHEEKPQSPIGFQLVHRHPMRRSPGVGRHPAWRRLVVRRTGSGFGDPASTSPAAGQYQGANAMSITLRFPLVKNHYYNKTTTIIIQNAGTANATASAAFHFPGWNYTYTTPTLKPRQMAAIEPIDVHTTAGLIHPPTINSNAYGYLIVTSSQPLAGVALEYYTMEDHATVLQATRGFTSNDFATTAYAPITKNNYYHRFTGLQVQNVSSQSVTLNVTYRATMENANPPNNPLG
jgi:hypothetical protein